MFRRHDGRRQIVEDGSQPYGNDDTLNLQIEKDIMKVATDEVVFDILRGRGGQMTSLEAWLVFKREVLSNILIREASKDLAIDCACSITFLTEHIGDAALVWRGYMEYFWTVTLSKDLPFQVVDDTSNGGLKLITKGEVTVEYLAVMGFLCPISDDEFTWLVTAKYYSTFKGSGTKRGILYGPLSLMNHSCCANWFFPNPRNCKNKYDRLERERCGYGPSLNPTNMK